MRYWSAVSKECLDIAIGVPTIWDNADDLSAKTLNKIKLYRNGDASVKDRAKDGYSFIKRACMHCVDPDCVSACPVTALDKDPITGIVTYDAKACIGCRYCIIACPFQIPTYEYEKALTPQIRKCTLCFDRTIENGQLPACVDVCPTEALIFGKRKDLIDLAHERIKKHPDKYIDHLYLQEKIRPRIKIY